MKTTLDIRIYYEDTDAGGVVFYANYLKYAERGRTEFFHSLGFSNCEFLNAQKPFAFMVRRCEIEYFKPAKLEDLIRLETEVVEAKGATMAFEQRVFKGDTLLVSMRIDVACALLTGRPTRIPAEIIEKLLNLT